MKLKAKMEVIFELPDESFKRFYGGDYEKMLYEENGWIISQVQNPYIIVEKSEISIVEDVKNE